MPNTFAYPLPSRHWPRSPRRGRRSVNRRLARLCFAPCSIPQTERSTRARPDQCRPARTDGSGCPQPTRIIIVGSVPAGVCAFSRAVPVTWRDVGTGCGRSGRPRPPKCRRAEPQPARPCMTFPGSGPPDDPGPASPAARELAPGSGTLTRMRPRTPAAPGRPGRVPASRAVTRDQLHRQGHGRCGMHDRRSTGATAIREDPGASRSRAYQPDADGVVRRAQRGRADRCQVRVPARNDEPGNLAARIREPAAAPARQMSMALHRAVSGGWILACLLAASACGSGSAHPAAAQAAPAAAATARPACTSGSAFALSLVSDRGGQPTPVAAAAWLARHGGVAGVPARGWRQASRQGRDATVRSGPVTLHAVQGPGRTWQVDSGSWCS